MMVTVNASGVAQRRKACKAWRERGARKERRRAGLLKRGAAADAWAPRTGVLLVHELDAGRRTVHRRAGVQAARTLAPLRRQGGAVVCSSEQPASARSRCGRCAGAAALDTSALFFRCPRVDVVPADRAGRAGVNSPLWQGTWGKAESAARKIRHQPRPEHVSTAASWVCLRWRTQTGCCRPRRLQTRLASTTAARAACAGTCAHNKTRFRVRVS